jgi:hypothetical protein
LFKLAASLWILVLAATFADTTDRNVVLAGTGCEISAGANCTGECNPQEGKWGCGCTFVDCVGWWEPVCQWTGCNETCCPHLEDDICDGAPCGGTI